MAKAKDRTKLRIANALKDLSRDKPLQKITINDIIEKSEINRSTFYNHFIDKDDLIEWIYNKDIATGFIEAKPACWLHNAEYLLNIWYKEKYFYSQAIQLNGINNLQSILFKTVYKHTEQIINNYLKDKSISKNSKDFICSYQAYAFTGMHIKYMQEGAKEDPKIFARRLYEISEKGLLHAIDHSLKLDQDIN